MEKADYNIASVTKALQLIDLLSRKNGQLSVQALAEKLDVSPSNVTRLLQTMRDAGFVEKSPKTNRYLLSNKFYVVTSNMLYSNECIQKYLPVAQRVAAKLNATVALNSLYRKNAVMLARAGGLYRSEDFSVGNLRPAYCSSAGKVMLSTLSEQQMAAFEEGLEFEQFQSNTIMDAGRLRRELEQIKRDGYAVEREERYIGLVSVSFALPEFAQPYAFTTIIPASRQRELFSNETLSYIRKCLQEAE